MSIDVPGQPLVKDCWNEDTTPDGFIIDPGWKLTSGIFGGSALVNTNLAVWEDDDPGSDHYDADSWPNSGSNCMNPTLGFEHATGDIWLTHCAYLESPGNGGQFYGSLLGVYGKGYVNTFGVPIQTEGNGDNGENDAIVNQVLTICDADFPQQCE